MSHGPKILSTLKTYTRAAFAADLFAGITVGVVALPLAMAFAIASGLPPERGLFTAIVAGLLISLLGGSKVQIGGPTGAFVVIVAGILGQFGYAGLVWITLLAGVLLILFGIFRLGSLIRFIPFPVTTGFTSGIALVIFSTQIKDLLGLPLDSLPAEFIPKWQLLLENLDRLNPAATGIGLCSIGTIILCRRFFPRLPAMRYPVITDGKLEAVVSMMVRTENFLEAVGLDKCRAFRITCRGTLAEEDGKLSDHPRSVTLELPSTEWLIEYDL